MQIVIVIIGLFLLLPGLCGAVFLPMGLTTPNDPYVDVVYALSGIGLVIGAVGVVLLHFARRGMPEESKPRGGAFIGYLVAGIVGAVMAFQFFGGMLGLTGVLGGFGRGFIFSAIIGLVGCWIVYWAARKLSGGRKNGQ